MINKVGPNEQKNIRMGNWDHVPPEDTTQLCSWEGKSGTRSTNPCSSSIPLAVDPDIEWLAHSNGVGHKILRAQGYEPGRGLGVNLQGRPQPISHKNLGVTIEINEFGGIKGGKAYSRTGLGYYSSKSQAPDKDAGTTGDRDPIKSKPQRQRDYVKTFSNYTEKGNEEDIYDAEDKHGIHISQTQFGLGVEPPCEDLITAEPICESMETKMSVNSLMAVGSTVLEAPQIKRNIPVFNTSSGEWHMEVISGMDRPKKEDVVYILQMLNLGGQKCLTFYDTGATCNIILGDLAEKLELPPVTGMKLNLRGIGNKAVWSPYGTYEFRIGPTKNTGKDVHLYVEGMPEITGYISEIDLKEIINEAMQNKTIAEGLANEKLPDKIGGTPVSLLIGLNQTEIMPVLRFTLPCGLAVFESQIADVNGSFWCFGGPHHSVTRINKLAKGLPYEQSIKLLREVVGAYIRSPYLQISRNHGIEENEIVPGVSCVKTGQKWGDDHSEANLCECQDVSHSNRQIDRSHHIHAVNTSKKRPTLAKLRIYEDQEDLGQDIAARCEDCATCTKCSHSARSRMISLQEEMEQEAIEKSIRLDLQNKQVKVGLPFTRSPVEHLKKLHHDKDSNFGQASKMFKANCRRIQDPKVRESLTQTKNELVKSGFMVKLQDLQPHQRKIIDEAGFRHFMPWTVAQKPASTSTKYRFAVDASITGLNEILAKGTNNLNKIEDILVRNRCKKYVWSSDVTKLYNQLKLEDQALPYGLFLFNDELNPDIPPEIYVMLVAWYGVSSTGNQASAALLRLATELQAEFPLARKIIERDMFVDDAFPGSNCKQEREHQIDQVRSCLDRGGFKLKFVVKSGEKPDPSVVDDKGRLKVLGYYWHPESDMMSPGFDELNFNKKRKGAKKPNPFPVKTEEDLNRLMEPMRLTKRMVASKMAEIFDPLGMLEAYKVQWKLDCQVLTQYGWDQVLPAEINEYFKERCKELVALSEVKWPRCVIHQGATDPCSIRLIGTADAAQSAAGAAIYACSKLGDDTFSCYLLTARSRLVAKTIPRNELEGVRLMAESMAKVIGALDGIRVESHYFTDSTIAMCWCSNMTLKLKMYVRSRVAEVRRNILGPKFRDMGEATPLYHIEGDMNPADLLTKPNGITPSALTPDHRWFVGDDWMRQCTSKLPGMSYEELSISGAQREEMSREFFKEPIIIKDSSEEEPEIGYVSLVQQGLAGTNNRSSPELRIHCPGCVQEETPCYGIHDLFEWDHCDYCICDPNDAWEQIMIIQNASGSSLGHMMLHFGWLKGMRILSQAIRFALTLQHRCHEQSEGIDAECMLCRFSEANPGEDSNLRLYQDLAVEMVLREESRRLKGILPKTRLVEYYEKEGILMYRSRLAHQFSEHDLERSPIPFFDQREIREELPVIGSDSELYLAYVNYIHFKVRRHAGVDSTLNEITQMFWPINNPKKLISRVRNQCSRCRIIERKAAELRMQSHPQERTLIAPPFFASQMDVVFGFKAQIHDKARRSIDMWALIICCLVTGATNILVMEGLATRHVIQALERHSARYAVPRKVYVDNGTNLVKLRDVSFSLRDFSFNLLDACGIEVLVSVAKAHEDQGRVERRVRELRASLEKLRDSVPPPKTHIAWETTFAQISNQLNDLPMAKSGRSRIQDPFWDVITPNRLILGRNNNRSLQGRMKIDYGSDLNLLVWKNEKIMTAWFKIFSDRIHHLMPRQKKWLTSSKIEKGDVVLFLVGDAKYDKDERWRLGQVDEVISPTRLRIKYYLSVSAQKGVMKTLERRPRQVSLVTKCSEAGTHSPKLLTEGSTEGESHSEILKGYNLRPKRHQSVTTK